MRITSIQLNNYRAFLNINDKDDFSIELPTGHNLLIYGENGSGKSSLFNAVRDFIFSSVNPDQPFATNKFYDADKVSEKPYIAVGFENDDNKYFYSEDPALTDSHTCHHIRKGVATYGFISYRDLLKLHLYEIGQSIDYFSFFFGKDGLLAEETLLTPSSPGNKKTYGQLWGDIEQEKDTQALEDYNINAAQLIARLTEKTNHLLLFFENKLKINIEYIDGQIDNAVTSPRILFHIELFGKEIESHHGILNEARLTSLAISIYFANLLSFPDNDFKFLFLDDIFIGLDMSNRIPLLEILTAGDIHGASFRSFQIFITTYDKEWFELAKSYLKDNWDTIEFLVDDHSAIPERPYIKKSQSHKERAEYHLLNGDYPACANYLRKAFEKELRRILPYNFLYPGRKDTSVTSGIIDIPKSHFTITDALETWSFNINNNALNRGYSSDFMGLEVLIGKFEKLITQYRIPFGYTNELRIIKNRLLNPLSHENLRSPVFKRELIQAFKILEEFSFFESRIILPVDSEESVLLTAPKENSLKTKYFYRFELLESLRFIRYKSFYTFLNVKCRSLYKQRFNGPQEVMEYDYTSVNKLCKSIFKDSTKSSSNDTIYDNEFEFNEIYTEDGKNIKELIK
ncbi:AAA family ATPase [Chitinophaga flava]|uniref:Rad50/SbcC-type AAA domain-containing protein n=1 Tax=Chitinophaga flava TaxID=2259036 RepID=A0A365Y5M5_9BACT|nr:AAA family ATPase [Chitinophaga flava]RBL93304.1 hypothetical protein DF182_12275 [Chitinophaga flava]